MSTVTAPMDDGGRRQGRGRLSTLEMLPEEADNDLAWLNEALREGKRPQVAILAEFNARLADHGIAPISKGTFSRYSVRKARQWREYDERLRLSKALCEGMGPDGADRMTVAVAERIKMAADELLSRGDLSAKEINALTSANRAAITAQRHSAELRRSLEDEQKKKLAQTLDKVEGQIASANPAAPIDAAAALKLIRQAYGVD
ncbi:phage protein Gp27 family protein [Sinorhizobium medicae]|uniref:phage protein Gp27 family protein n=1 Tax=Sinorhizobium medicae TaxID=110321 RepID=UPI0004629E46|nr:phage protein Gp27 family protein [Sinorhizobium medicae]